MSVFSIRKSWQIIDFLLYNRARVMNHDGPDQDDVKWMFLSFRFQMWEEKAVLWALFL